MKKTKNKLLALVDYKEQYESPISDKKIKAVLKVHIIELKGIRGNE